MAVTKSRLICLVLVLGLYSCGKTLAQTAPSTKNAAPEIRETPKEEAPADITGDARLDRSVSLHEIGIPLDELLQKVSQGGPTLTADENCRGLDLHLNLINRPVRRLMTSLAYLVPGTWYNAPDGKGYVLKMGRAAVARRRRWWDLFLAERARLLDELPERAMEAMGAKPEIKGEVHSADGNDERFKQLLLSGPRFFVVLPDSLKERIAHNVNTTLLYAGAGARGGSGFDEVGVIVPVTSLPPEARQQLSTRRSFFRPPARRCEYC